MPQESCLGPLLFLLYINDLRHALNSSPVSLYADDASLCFRSKHLKTLNGALNESLQRLDSWLQGNMLSLNVVKTTSLLIASNQKKSIFCKAVKSWQWKSEGGGIEATPSYKTSRRLRRSYSQ